MSEAIVECRLMSPGRGRVCRGPMHTSGPAAARDAVALATVRHLPPHLGPITGPVAVAIDCRMPRPKLSRKRYTTGGERPGAWSTITTPPHLPARDEATGAAPC